MCEYCFGLTGCVYCDEKEEIEEQDQKNEEPEFSC